MASLEGSPPGTLGHHRACRPGTDLASSWVSLPQTPVTKQQGGESAFLHSCLSKIGVLVLGLGSSGSAQACCPDLQ